MITVAVGSENPVKIEATRSAFQKMWPKEKIKVVSVKLSSGVSDQPMSDKESITGAKSRARQSLNLVKADFGVGLEGGLQKIGNVWFDCGWIVVQNKKGQIGIGSTIHMEAPAKVMRTIRMGKELGDVNDQLFGLKNSKQVAGYFGAMTKGAITRTEGYRDGVIAALVRFVHPSLWN